MIRPALSLLAVLGLAGCSAIAAFERSGTPTDVFELRAPDSAPVARATQDSHVIVEVPTASGAVDTDSILVRPSSTQVTYLPGARWSATAPVMLQTAIVESLLRSEAFRFVGRRPLGASGDVALVSDLTEFGAVLDAETDRATVRITLVARLVREEDAEVVASRTFERQVPVPDTDTPDIVAGFEAASDAVIADLVAWVLATRGVPAGPA